MTHNNDATLDGIPVEMVANVCTFLPKNDLLSLRLTSRYFASVTVTELAEQLRWRLQEVPAIVTEDGFRLLLGLCQIPEFRQHVLQVRFFDHRFYDPRTAYVWDDLVESDRKALRIMAAEEKEFESSGQALAMLTDIIDLLKLAPNLQGVTVGKFRTNWDSIPNSIGGFVHNPQKFCGVTCLLAKLGLEEELSNFWALVVEGALDGSDLQHPFWAVFEALKTNNIHRRVVGVTVIDPYLLNSSLGRSEAYKSRKVWGVLQLPCLWTVSILDKHHSKSKEDGASGSTMNQLLGSISEVENLSPDAD
jgi:hypothetical protein